MNLYTPDGGLTDIPLPPPEYGTPLSPGKLGMRKRAIWMTTFPVIVH